jgi:hypothetical protein
MNNETQGFTGFEIFLVGVLIIISVIPFMAISHLDQTEHEKQRLMNYVKCVEARQSTETCISVDDLLNKANE